MRLLARSQKKCLILRAVCMEEKQNCSSRCNLKILWTTLHVDGANFFLKLALCSLLLAYLEAVC